MTDEELEPSAADRRLAEILKGTVDAFELDPSEPPRLFSVGGGVIKHPAWPLDPWLVRRHDVLQLEDLGLVGSEALPQDGIAFWPTPDGRKAVRAIGDLLERRSEQVESDSHRSTLQKWAGRLQASQVQAGLEVQAIALGLHFLLAIHERARVAGNPPLRAKPPPRAVLRSRARPTAAMSWSRSARHHRASMRLSPWSPDRELSRRSRRRIASAAFSFWRRRPMRWLRSTLVISEGRSSSGVVGVHPTRLRAAAKARACLRALVR